jgi:hypothetical protein
LHAGFTQMASWSDFGRLPIETESVHHLYLASRYQLEVRVPALLPPPNQDTLPATTYRPYRQADTVTAASKQFTAASESMPSSGSANGVDAIYGTSSVLQLRSRCSLELADPASLMCSYTRDPHLRPKAAPLPPSDVASHKKQLHSLRRYKSSLDVLLAILQSGWVPCSYRMCLAVQLGTL